MTLTIRSRSIWHQQWIPQMWFPIDVEYILYVYLAPIRCYSLLICDGTAYDLDHWEMGQGQMVGMGQRSL